MKLPFLFVNVAMTADGKLAPANRVFVPFGSPRDQELLLELRAQADAVMAGARTIDLFPVNMGPGGKKYQEMRFKRGLAEYNLRVIVSGSGSVSPKANIFKHRFSPIIILTTGRISTRRMHRLSGVADEVRICGESEIDWPETLGWLRQKWKVKRLLCEGGGELNEGLFRAGVVNELHVTICPFIFGGQKAPTMADGQGIGNLAEAVRLKLNSKKRVADEMFLVFGVRRAPSSRLKARQVGEVKTGYEP